MQRLKKRRFGEVWVISTKKFIKPDFIVSFISEPIGEGSVLSDFLGKSFFELEGFDGTLKYE